jgi:hypothetical protein
MWLGVFDADANEDRFYVAKATSIISDAEECQVEEM